jgi:lipoprotein-anchoring transpeptidase ErfK/SrfK
MLKVSVSLVLMTVVLCLGTSQSLAECANWPQCVFEENARQRNAAPRERERERPESRRRDDDESPKTTIVREREKVPMRIETAYSKVIVVNIQSGWYAAYWQNELAFLEIKGEMFVLSGNIAAGTSSHPTPVTDLAKGPQRIGRRSANYRSRTYPKPDGGAPMPLAQFISYDGKIDDGIAFHVGDVREDGRPLSHGCIRLERPHAQALWKFVDLYDSREDPIRVIVVRNFSELREKWQRSDS